MEEWKEKNEKLQRLVDERTAELKTTIKNLKATQSQLIHAEKMASLGELTAGIAHEIQNPLNFVNNFSEVSVDLIEELNEEIQKGEADEVASITRDLRQNLEKISYHGTRASSIVKGMLEHSRSSTGEKVAVDINALAEEYLRLAYHGLRAKDKSFNADFKCETDESIPAVQMVAQDINRVLLNLFNNAFYSVDKKARRLGGDYQPGVIVSTHLLETPSGKKSISISVKDNGDGIPEDIMEKIFQPFFTTKPTGEGTGLGLSLSYDIITKGHGGELKVESRKGEGASFIIVIPIIE
jgi:signal transduction histidine kinase